MKKLILWLMGYRKLFETDTPYAFIPTYTRESNGKTYKTKLVFFTVFGVKFGYAEIWGKEFK